MTQVTEPLDVALTADDEQSIVDLCHDYVEAWYEGDHVGLGNCLHPDLVKRTIVRDQETGNWELEKTTTAEMLVAYTKERVGTETPEKDRVIDITILDGFRHVACAKVISAEYVDYVQAAKFDERWLVVNILWELKKGHIDR